MEHCGEQAMHCGVELLSVAKPLPAKYQITGHRLWHVN